MSIEAAVLWGGFLLTVLVEQQYIATIEIDGMGSTQAGDWTSVSFFPT